MKNANQIKREAKVLREAVKVLEGLDSTVIDDIEDVIKKLDNQAIYAENSEYLKAVERNFKRGDFKINKQKIKLVLASTLQNLVQDEYIKQARIAQERFGATVSLNPTIQDLKKFLLTQ